MNSHEIKNAKLEKSAFGYKSESVEEFVSSVYEYAKSLEEQNAVIEKKMTVLAKKIEEYRADEGNMKEALLGAQRLGQTVINEANEKASVAIAQANIEAEKILKEAKNEAEKKGKELKLQIAAEEKSLLKMKKEVSEFKSKLLTIYKSHLDVITALPEVEAEEKAEEEISDAEPGEAEAEQAPDSGESSAQENEQKSVEEMFRVDIGADDEKKNETNSKADHVKDNFTEKFGELKFGKNIKE